MKENTEYIVRFDNYSLGYGKSTIIKGLNLEIIKGERFCILGPSGGGKTTLLNAITGVANFTNGVFTSGSLEILTSENKSKLSIGYVFQDLALFPHLTVRENIAFPLRIKKLPKAEISARVKSILDMLKITDKGDSRINILSGGQKQRVALGRALVGKPSILCMDEALKGLDPLLKIDFLNNLLEIQELEKFTLIYVTHDIDEANFCAHRMCILDEGIIQQLGTPNMIYSKPANLKTALLTGEVINLELNRHPALNELAKLIDNKMDFKRIVFRPENISFEDILPNTAVEILDNKIIFSGEVKFNRFMGKNYRNYISIDKEEIHLDAGNFLPGTKIAFSVPIKNIFFTLNL